MTETTLSDNNGELEFSTVLNAVIVGEVRRCMQHDMMIRR